MASSLAPPPKARPRLQQPWVWRLQVLLSTYLPLLLMALLATGTWWLIKHTPGDEEPQQAAPARHEPDYRMRKFDLQRLGSNGQLRARIEGQELRHYPDTDTLEIDGIELRAHSSDGSLLLATAKRAVSNADASELQLYGDVRVRRFEARPEGSPQTAPKLEISGEFLQAFVNTERLRSHLPVQLNHGGGTVQALSFEYDHLNGRLAFKGRTNASFTPRSTARKSAAATASPATPRPALTGSTP